MGIHVLALCMAMVIAVAAHADERDPALPEDHLFPHAGASAPHPETTFLPTGDLFKPLIADPKEPRFYLSYRVFKFNSDQIHAAVGGYGEVFGLYRHLNTSGGYSWQANFGGGIHAQFDIDAPSFALVNADYTIGFPFSFRKGSASYRLAIFHQSSHLGDEYILQNNVDRIELSYEALELIGSYEWTQWRVYYGGEYIVHQGPTDIKPASLHGGVEYCATNGIAGSGRLVGGWDLKSDQDHEWSLNSSVKTGLQYDSSEGNGRFIRVLAEGYMGFSPYGQFYTYQSRMAYAGIGIYLGFE